MAGMTPTSIAHLSAEQLRRAAAIREEIDSLQAQLEGLLSGDGRKVTRGKKKAAKKKGAKRKMSKAGRERIAAAARRRWAKLRKDGKVATKKKGAKRKMSKEGRERIAAAARKRWAKVRAEKAKQG